LDKDIHVVRYLSDQNQRGEGEMSKNLPVPKIGKLPWDPKMADHQTLKHLRPYVAEDGTISVAIIDFYDGPQGPIARFQPILAPGVEREILASLIKFRY